MFISFEGIDGSGKSTQVSLLTNYLSNLGYQVIATKEPTVQVSDDYDPVTLFLIYTVDRHFHINKLIAPALGAGKIVICDRYTDSTVAYQGYGMGVDLGRDKHKATLTPDITFWLDITPQLAIERQIARSHQEQDLPFLERVREGYLSLYTKNPNRIRRIDGSGAIDEVFNQIKATLIERLLF